MFDPIVINAVRPRRSASASSSAGIDGAGKIDCNGGEPTRPSTTRVDHNTNTAPGANGGLPQDPECNDTRTDPAGGISNACLESAVGTCNPSNLHPACATARLEYIESGTFGSGDMRLIRGC